MKTIPLQAIAAPQTVSIVLENQNCQINIIPRGDVIFFDLNADDIEICSGVLALNAVPLVSREYAGFIGNLMFIDSQGESDPIYSGLGVRYQLVYLTGEEYALIV